MTAVVEDDGIATLGAWVSAGKCGSTAWRLRNSPISGSRLAAAAGAGRITYGLERSRCTCRGRKRFDLVWTKGTNTAMCITERGGTVEIQFEFERNWLFQQFNDYESEAKRLMELNLRCRFRDGDECSHTFNLLDARRDFHHRARAYIGRVRALARLVAQSYYIRASG